MSLQLGMVGWGKKMANYFLRDATNCIAQIGTAILNREAHDDAVLHALLVLFLPPPAKVYFLPKTSLTSSRLSSWSICYEFTSLPLTEINHKLPARNIIESPWITLQLTLACTRTNKL